MRDFVLGGAELQGAAKKRFAEIQERQAELGQKFSENVLDATDAFAYYADASELDGVPHDVLAAARAAAEAEGKDGYKLTLQMPCYLPVMQFATSRALRERCTAPTPPAPASSATRRFDNTRADRARSWPCARKRRSCWATATSPKCRWCPRWPSRREQVMEFLRDLAASAPALCRARPGRAARVRRRRELGLDRPATLGLDLRRREAQGSALRLQRAGGEAVLHRAQGAGRPVQDRRDAVRRRDPPRHARRSGTRTSVLPHRARRRAGRPVLSRPFRARRQARRRLDGRRARPLAAPGRRHAADAGGAPGVQLRRGRRRQAAAAHARRRDHAVPRVRPRPAPHADAGERARRLGHQRRRVGRGRAAQPVHGELLLGMGRAART